jgi:hypothetical protein
MAAPFQIEPGLKMSGRGIAPCHAWNALCFRSSSVSDDPSNAGPSAPQLPHVMCGLGDIYMPINRDLQNGQGIGSVPYISATRAGSITLRSSHLARICRPSLLFAFQWTEPPQPLRILATNVIS